MKKTLFSLVCLTGAAACGCLPSATLPADKKPTPAPEPVTVRAVPTPARVTADQVNENNTREILVALKREIEREEQEKDE